MRCPRCGSEWACCCSRHDLAEFAEYGPGGYHPGQSPFSSSLGEMVRQSDREDEVRRYERDRERRDYERQEEQRERERVEWEAEQEEEIRRRNEEAEQNAEALTESEEGT